eukprot:UN27170
MKPTNILTFFFYLLPYYFTKSSKILKVKNKVKK